RPAVRGWPASAEDVMASQLPAHVARRARARPTRCGLAIGGSVAALIEAPCVGDCTPRWIEARRVVRYVRKAAAMPQALVTLEPGSSRISPTPVRKAFGGQVMGSTARLRLWTSGSGSPVKTIR